MYIISLLSVHFMYIRCIRAHMYTSLSRGMCSVAYVCEATCRNRYVIKLLLHARTHTYLRVYTYLHADAYSYSATDPTCPRICMQMSCTFVCIVTCVLFTRVTVLIIVVSKDAVALLLNAADCCALGFNGAARCFSEHLATAKDPPLLLTQI